MSRREHCPLGLHNNNVYVTSRGSFVQGFLYIPQKCGGEGISISWTIQRQGQSFLVNIKIAKQVTRWNRRRPMEAPGPREVGKATACNPQTRRHGSQLQGRVVVHKGVWRPLIERPGGAKSESRIGTRLTWCFWWCSFASERAECRKRSAAMRSQENAGGETRRRKRKSISLPGILLCTVVLVHDR